MSGSISNTELRDRLIELGENPGPISTATRSVYLKRLERLTKTQQKNVVQKAVEENASKRVLLSKRASTVTVGKASTTSRRTQPPTRKAFGFSSDESDTNGVVDHPKATVKPAAPPVVQQQKVTTTRRKTTTAATNSDSTVTTTTKQQIHNRIINNIKTKMQQQTNGTTTTTTNGYSDDSDMDCTVNESTVDCADVGTSPMTPTTTNHQSTPKRMQLKRQSLLSPTQSPILNNSNYASTYPTRPSSKENTETTTTTTPTLRPRSHLTSKFASTSTPPPSSTRSYVTQASRHQHQPSAVTPPSFLTKVKQFLGFEPKPQQSTRVTSHRVSSLYHGNNKPIKSSWPLHCSDLLPYAILGFFMLLGLLYIVMNADHVQDTPILGEDISVRMRIVNQIFEVLGTAAGNKLCSYSNEDRLHVSDVKKLAKTEESEFSEALGLICKYPKWQIYLYKDNDDGAAGTSLITSCDELHLVTYMSSQQAFLPALCRLTRAFRRILVGISAIVICVCLMWGIYRYHQYLKKKKETEQREMYSLVDKIMELVEKQHVLSEMDESVEKFIPIIQARDMLLPISQRKQKKKIWEKAVDYIADNDSRVRVENQRVCGEDHIVWRWVQVKSPHSSPTHNGRNSGGSRTWQGEAFDMKSCSNAPVVSPSSCLKIRNVFNSESERNDNWEFEIQDAILEKCSNCHDIICIVVEKASSEGLVYIKCGSSEEAGKVFRALHGAWFDGRLITVKFLKLKRFQERYPQHVHKTTPLQHHFTRQISNFTPPITNVSSI